MTGHEKRDARRALKRRILADMRKSRNPAFIKRCAEQLAILLRCDAFREKHMGYR
jgi:hypothetical protein